MKTIFLLPPSEGKNSGGNNREEELSFLFPKPKGLSINASEKDLKCKGKRYKEAIELNKKLFSLSIEVKKAINRYSGVMYSAIDYHAMTGEGKEFFENNFLILSGMYGVLRINDEISNYKLPIETKGLLSFWGDKVTKAINGLNADYIVNLLPNSYKKLINTDKLNSKIININFLHNKDGSFKKITHGVKKIKGEWIKKMCEKGEFDYKKVAGEIVRDGKKIEINIIN